MAGSPLTSTVSRQTVLSTAQTHTATFWHSTAFARLLSKGPLRKVQLYSCTAVRLGFRKSQSIDQKGAPDQMHENPCTAVPRYRYSHDLITAVLELLMIIMIPMA